MQTNNLLRQDLSAIESIEIIDVEMGKDIKSISEQKRLQGILLQLLDTFYSCFCFVNLQASCFIDLSISH